MIYQGTYSLRSRLKACLIGVLYAVILMRYIEVTISMQWRHFDSNISYVLVIFHKVELEVLERVKIYGIKMRCGL